jgi:ABC-type multidrug transport system ATPase subunit
MAMVVNPRVLFLDEPTSGLDSYTANEVMTAVKALASDGVTVCATIHSPSPYTFNLFDSLLVLVRGETVYFGPNGSDMLSYFRGLAVKPPSTQLMGGSALNNADYLTDLVVGADREGRAHEYAAAYAQHALSREMLSVIESNAKVRCKLKHCKARFDAVREHRPVEVTPLADMIVSNNQLYQLDCFLYCRS